MNSMILKQLEFASMGENIFFKRGMSAAGGSRLLLEEYQVLHYS
jgi:hypothetical protein